MQVMVYDFWICLLHILCETSNSVSSETIVRQQFHENDDSTI